MSNGRLCEIPPAKQGIGPFVTPTVRRDLVSEIQRCPLRKYKNSFFGRRAFRRELRIAERRYVNALRSIQ